jgi:integrase
MARKAKGEVVPREWKSGRGFALRLTAYGKRHYLTLGLERDGWTRERAGIELDNIMADVRRGIWVAPEKPGRRPEALAASEAGEVEKVLFPAFAGGLLRSRKGRHSDRHHGYLEWGLKHLEPFFATVTPAQIDAEMVDAYAAAKLAEGRELAEAIERGRPLRDGRGMVRKPLSPVSINKTIDVLAWVLGFAVEYRKRTGVTENVAAGKKRRVGEPPRRPVHLDSAEQIEAILDAAEELDGDLRFSLTERRVIVATFIFSGPRDIEIGHMLWRDVDLANGRIMVGRSKTQAGLREVAMLPIERDVLAAHKASSPHTDPDDLVCPTSDGTVRSRKNLCAGVVAPVLRRADELLVARGHVPLPKGVSPHKLRHTFASILIATGVDVASVKEQLGHTDAKFTLNVYTHMMARSPEERARLRALVEGEREGHEPAPARLGWRAFEAPILRVLAAAPGGRARRRAVIRALAEEMDGRLGEADRADYRGAPRWHVDADLARRHMRERGLLRKTRKQGVWALGEAAAGRIGALRPLPARPDLALPDTDGTEHEEALVA